MVSVEDPARERRHWNAWNAGHREHGVERVSEEQSAVLLDWLTEFGRTDLEILDVGCGTGWFTDRITGFGDVTATDLADEVVARAQLRTPEATFVAGDFLSLDLGVERFDVVVSLEVLSHVPDQPLFFRRIARALKPGGVLLLATQNRPALLRNKIPPPPPGARRRWVDRHELTDLLGPEFRLRDLSSITPTYNRGPLHLINSRTLARVAERVRLGRPLAALVRWEEQHFLGWTLMARAVRR